MNFFGKKRTSAPAPTRNGGGNGSDPTSTIVTLRESLKTLDKREDHIQKKADQLLAEAKANLKAKDKKKAAHALKRKKMYDAQIEKIQGELRGAKRQAENVACMESLCTSCLTPRTKPSA